jgi:hypothetical protein
MKARVTAACPLNMRISGQLILILSGGARHAAVPVVPQSLLRAGVSADTGQVTS